MAEKTPKEILDKITPESLAESVDGFKKRIIDPLIDQLALRNECRYYLTGRASARKQSLWNEMGTWDPQRNADGHLINRPRDYWCPVVVIGKKRHGVVGPNPDGSSGAPSGYLERKDAIASAERFLAKCREILREAGE